MPDDPAIADESAAETETGRFVTQSSSRITVFERLSEGPASASMIADDRAIAAADARNAADAFHDRGLVELLVTDDVHAYGLTAQGEQVLFSLKQKGMI